MSNNENDHVGLDEGITYLRCSDIIEVLLVMDSVSFVVEEYTVQVLIIENVSKKG